MKEIEIKEELEKIFYSEEASQLLKENLMIVAKRIYKAHREFYLVGECFIGGHPTFDELVAMDGD